MVPSSNPTHKGEGHPRNSPAFQVHSSSWNLQSDPTACCRHISDSGARPPAIELIHPPIGAVMPPTLVGAIPLQHHLGRDGGWVQINIAIELVPLTYNQRGSCA